MVSLNASYGIYITVIVFLIILLDLIHGYKNGFLASLFQLIRLILCLGLSSYFSPVLSKMFPLVNMKTSGFIHDVAQYFQIKGSQIFWFIILFVVLMGITSILIRVLKITNKIPLVGTINRILGVILGLGISFIKLYVCLIILFLPIFSNAQSAIDTSILKHIQPYTQKFDSYLQTINFSQIVSKLSENQSLSEEEKEKIVNQLVKEKLSSELSSQIMESIKP